MSDFNKFITDLYDEIDQPEEYSTTRLSAWFLDPSNLGKLNNLIGTDYQPTGLYDTDGVTITGYYVTPDFGNNELGIYKLLFDYNYFNQLARNSAIAAGSAIGDWTSLAEGDSKITRVNKNEVSKTFRGLARDARETLDHSVKMYLKYGAIPQQVVGDDTVGLSSYVVTEYNTNYFRREIA